MRNLIWLLLIAGTALGQVTPTTAMVTVSNCGASGPATSSVDVYRPTGPGPFPLVAIGHGFQNNKSNAGGLAQALVALGIVVVVPQFPLAFSPCYTDHARNARVMLAAMDQQIAVGGIDVNRLGFAGHSAGGLSAFLAAAQRPVAAVVLFDPVDFNNLGGAVAATVASPVLFTFAEPSTCNDQLNSVPWYAAVRGPKARLKVVNANHCDPQEPISGTCTLGCGGMAATSTTRSALFKRYAVDLFKRYLLGQTMPCLETKAQADATAGTITTVDFQLGGCGVVTPDAGVPTDAGAVADAGVPIDAGISTDAGSRADGGAALDSGVPDAGSSDAGSSDAGSSDAGSSDAGSSDAGSSDAGSSDAGSRDAGSGQAGTDAGPNDAGSSDAGQLGEPPAPVGCSCAVADSWGLLMLASLALVSRASRRTGAVTSSLVP